MTLENSMSIRYLEYFDCALFQYVLLFTDFFTIFAELSSSFRMGAEHQMRGVIA